MIIARNVGSSSGDADDRLGVAPARRQVARRHRAGRARAGRSPAAFAGVGRGSVPDLPTTEVKKGEFVDAIEIRGDIRPLRSVVLAAPMQSGELQIVKLAKNGTHGQGRRRGRRVRRLDAAPDDAGEAVGAEAGGSGDRAGDRAVAHHAGAERHRADARQVQHRAREARRQTRRHRFAHREREGQADADGRASRSCASSRRRSSRTTTSIEADLSSKRRKREKALFDLQRAERGLQNLQLKAPVAGMVNILPNYRSGGPFGGGEVEFREGDRAWAGRRDRRAAGSVVGPPRGAARRDRSRPAERRPGSGRSASRRFRAGSSRRRSNASRCSPASTSPAGRRRGNFDLSLVADRHRSEDPSGHERGRAHRRPIACPT